MKWCTARGEAMVGEIAARLSGGYMSGWTYPYASGIEVTREALQIAAGIRPDPSPRDRGWVGAERAFISIPGRVAEVLGTRAAEAMPYIKNVSPGFLGAISASFPSNNVEKCGNVIAQGPDRASASCAADAAIRGILVRLEASRAETETFLEAEAGQWPPRAFSPPPSVLAAIATLPDTCMVEAGGQFPLVLALPKASIPENYGECDWAGRGFLESAELALRPCGRRLRSRGGPHLPLPGLGPPPPALGGRFWKALLKGGAQAALYVLDTGLAEGGGPLISRMGPLVLAFALLLPPGIVAEEEEGRGERRGLTGSPQSLDPPQPPGRDFATQG